MGVPVFIKAILATLRYKFPGRENEKILKNFFPKYTLSRNILLLIAGSIRSLEYEI